LPITPPVADLTDDSQAKVTKHFAFAMLSPSAWSPAEPRTG
jgi:hypothetical protein